MCPQLEMVSYCLPHSRKAQAWRTSHRCQDAWAPQRPRSRRHFIREPEATDVMGQGGLGEADENVAGDRALRCRRACVVAGGPIVARPAKAHPTTSPSVGPVATDPVDGARAEDGHAVSPLIAPQHSGAVAGGRQAGPTINFDVDCGEDRHLTLQTIPAPRV